MPNDRTLAQCAYDEIRAMIVSGELAGGRKLIVRMLSERLDLSATPIKSALAALERDGFLVAIPHRGFYVPEIGLRDMREIYELREALDGIAARKVTEAGAGADFVRDELQPILERQHECAAAGDLAGLRDLDTAFHRAIWHRCGNARLAQVTDNLGGQSRLAWQWQVAGGMLRALREHQLIMDAIVSGDPSRAERAARSHVRLSRAAFEKAVRERGPEAMPR
ncbi:GntR family transcriptional regulator [Micromonospora sp. WMMD975]|uniref:GntR family transcriptional regulator n=1 Tax=Micromonospora sp. WMMD975 TaxID=3016087 RepID=UPI00249B5D7B|nr:GntR family transcriptional regulator [Micromonospora sp. WMMD975]WFE35210.1 GntR family transcriptional regulator [Micromonospora sp. WMMD975]